MTFEEHEKAISQARSALNEAMRAATKEGFRTVAEIHTYPAGAGHGPVDLVKVTMMRVIA